MFDNCKALYAALLKIGFQEMTYPELKRILDQFYYDADRDHTEVSVFSPVYPKDMFFGCRKIAVGICRYTDEPHSFTVYVYGINMRNLPKVSTWFSVRKTYGLFYDTFAMKRTYMPCFEVFNCGYSKDSEVMVNGKSLFINKHSLCLHEDDLTKELNGFTDYCKAEAYNFIVTNGRLNPFLVKKKDRRQ